MLRNRKAKAPDVALSPLTGVPHGAGDRATVMAAQPEARSVDPISWLGPSVSGLAYTSQSHFRAALSTCLELRAMRLSLSEKLGLQPTVPKEPSC